MLRAGSANASTVYPSRDIRAVRAARCSRDTFAALDWPGWPVASAGVHRERERRTPNERAAKEGGQSHCSPTTELFPSWIVSEAGKRASREETRERDADGSRVRHTQTVLHDRVPRVTLLGGELVFCVCLGFPRRGMCDDRPEGKGGRVVIEAGSSWKLVSEDAGRTAAPRGPLLVLGETKRRFLNLAPRSGLSSFPVAI